MDYTPISAHRVLLAFSVTAFVALGPVLFMFLQSSSVGFVAGQRGGYRGLVLGAETFALTLVLLGLISVTVMFGRRMVRRPFRV
jgi:hypothetical protein